MKKWEKRNDWCWRPTLPVPTRQASRHVRYITEYQKRELYGSWRAHASRSAGQTLFLWLITSVIFLFWMSHFWGKRDKLFNLRVFMREYGFQFWGDNIPSKRNSICNHRRWVDIARICQGRTATALALRKSLFTNALRTTFFLRYKMRRMLMSDNPNKIARPLRLNVHFRKKYNPITGSYSEFPFTEGSWSGIF